MLSKGNRTVSDIFISYKREEQGKAEQLAVALKKKGWSVWWDPHLRAGERFDDAIQRALSSAKCVIALLSRRSIESTYVMNEARYALRRDKLIPVAIEVTELPFDFEGLHTPRLIDWDGSEKIMAFKDLIDDIAAKLGQPITAEPKQVASGAPGDGDRVTGTVFQDTLEDGSKGPEMVFIAGGRFEMGSDPKVDSVTQNYEQPRHPVTVDAFYIGKFEVTFEEYEIFAHSTKRELPEDQGWGHGRRPVINVSWHDAVAYTEWLSEQTGKRYRLPTEAEWEYAAGAGTDTIYWWGNDIRQDGKVWTNCGGCGSEWDGEKTAPVGSFQPNPFGIYDTAGNVWEWVQDCWHGSYEGSPDDGSAWEAAGSRGCAQRVIRGGSWHGKPWKLRSANRFWVIPGYRYGFLGFRLARDVQ
jgi:formylglycine-generating enzyme required for sulfatase activity